MPILIETCSQQLKHFTRQVLLPAVPRLAWWALGLIGFSALNLLFRQELWPHQPQAATWCAGMLLLGLGLLPLLGAVTAQRLALLVRGWWWRGFWQLVAIGAYIGAAVASFGLLLAGVMSVQYWFG